MNKLKLTHETYKYFDVCAKSKIEWLLYAEVSLPNELSGEAGEWDARGAGSTPAVGQIFYHQSLSFLGPLIPQAGHWPNAG